MAREGAPVAIFDSNEETGRGIVDGLTADGHEAAFFAVDVSIEAEVRDAVAQAMAHFGKIDILHNNIGIVEIGGPVETSEENFDKVIAVNLKSMYLTCKSVLPIMERQGKGAIVNISSIASIRFTVPWIAYNVSKGAVNSLTMGIAAQYAPTGVRCNAIAPGLLSTPMVYAPHKDNHASMEDMMRARDAAVPMGWQGEGWDVGEASVFLASDEARFITGHVLMVDGGSSLCMPSTPWRRSASGASPQ